MIPIITRPNEYILAWSKDPALDLSEDEATRKEQLRVARETGNWDDITKPGEKVTLFTMRFLDRDKELWEWDQWRDKNGQDKSQTLRGWSMLFRLALVKVTNFPHKVPKRIIDRDLGLSVVPSSFLEPFGSAADLLVLELGLAIFAHENDTLPKS